MELILQLSETILDDDHREYFARVFGCLIEGTWYGFICFTPTAGGESWVTERETTQPNRAGLEYWASGLTPIYLDGALHRATRRGDDALFRLVIEAANRDEPRARAQIEAAELAAARARALRTLDDTSLLDMGRGDR